MQTPTAYYLTLCQYIKVRLHTRCLKIATSSKIIVGLEDVVGVAIEIFNVRKVAGGGFLITRS
jgi:hypothetical protein